MRLGVASALAHANAHEWAENLVELGCRAVVFPIDHTASENEIADYVDEARAHDLKIAEVGIWKNVLATDERARETAREYAKGQLRLADEIGASCCVNIAGAYGGPVWDGGYKGNFSRECREAIVSYIQELLDEIKPKNTVFSLEPMPWMLPTGPDEYLKLLYDVDREAFGVHLDAVNMINSPERYFFCEEFLTECFAKLSGRIRSCHIKDVKLRRKLTFQLAETFCGDGEFPLDTYLRLAHKEDPDIPMIIEHLNTDAEYRSSFKFVQKKLADLQFS